MKKYAGKEDFTQEDINMIAGCGFNDISAQLQENTQALRRIETELQQLRNMSFLLDQIRSTAQDLNKTATDAMKEILYILNDLLNAKIAQEIKNTDQEQMNKTMLESLRILSDQITQDGKEVPEG